MTEQISIIDSMKLALYFWKKYFVKIVIIGFFIYIPTQICIELSSLFIEKTGIFDRNEVYRVYNFIRDMIGSIASLGIINFTVRILENKEEQAIKEVIIHGLKKWPKFIGLEFIAGLKILGYSILLIIPGIYKFVKLSFIDCTMSTNNNDHKNGSDEPDALDESERLVENQWWRVFSFLLLMFFLSLLLELIFLPLVLTLKSIFFSILIGVIINILKTYFIVVKAIYYLKIKKLKDEYEISNELSHEVNNYK